MPPVTFFTVYDSGCQDVKIKQSRRSRVHGVNVICLVFSCASVWLLLQSMALVSRRSVSLAYREEDAVPTGNATTQSYLRCLEAALDHADPGFWAPPFWDCYLSKWVFGFTVALPGQRSVQYSLSFNSTEQQWRNYRIRFLDTFACQPLNQALFGLHLSPPLPNHGNNYACQHCKLAQTVVGLLPTTLTSNNINFS